MPGVDEVQGTPGERREGSARPGRVSIRDFDLGALLTVGAELKEDPGGVERYYLVGVRNACPSPGNPGIPIYFAYPDDKVVQFEMPCIVVRRDEMTPALNRWHPGSMQYRTPGAGSLKRVSPVTGRTGFSHMEEMAQAIPYDFGYTYTIWARNRGGRGQQAPRNQVNALVMYLMSKLQNAFPFKLIDSVGDYRFYQGFQESVSPSDEVGEVGERIMGMTLSVNILGELDLNDAMVHNTVTEVVSRGDLNE